MRGRLAALALILGLLLTGCAAGERASASEFAPEEGERLVVYTSHKEEVYWPIIQEFEARTGIWVEVEAGGTSELLARLRREADAPAADVMFGGGVDSLEAYQDCFSPYVCAGWEGLDPAMRSEEGLWTPFSALPVVIIYNTKLVVPGQITGWRDLFSPAWQGRIAFCDPSVSGSSFTGLITLLRAVDGDTDETLMRFAVSLDGRQLDSSGAVLDSVAGGTDLVGITLEETALKRAAAGEDIALIYPDDGTSCIPEIDINLYDVDLKKLKILFEKAKEEARNNIDMKRQKITLNEWFEEWFANYKIPNIKETSVFPMRSKYYNTFGKAIGNMKVTDIRNLDIQRVINDMNKQGRASSSMRDALGRVRECLESAKNNRIIDINPCFEINVPWENKTAERRFLSMAEQTRFLQEVEHNWYKEMFYIMFLTGMRIGEVGGLKWEDIDWNKKCINIQRSLSCQYENGVKTMRLTKPEAKNDRRLTSGFHVFRQGIK